MMRILSVRHSECQIARPSGQNKLLFSKMSHWRQVLLHSLHLLPTELSHCSCDCSVVHFHSRVHLQEKLLGWRAGWASISHEEEGVTLHFLYTESIYTRWKWIVTDIWQVPTSKFSTSSARSLWRQVCNDEFAQRLEIKWCKFCLSAIVCGHLATEEWEEGTKCTKCSDLLM